jgi:serine/threonine-protein kinase
MVGAFRLEEAIGVGGMGAVFRALDTQLDRLVALKLLPPDQAVDPEVVERFYQEGRSAAQLDHENIARVFSIGQDGPFHYIAFEYIEGVTLRQRVESGGPLTPAQAVDVALQIANALIHASRRGVVHRDIKPSNIILTPQGRAKVVDMGLARRFERGGDRGLTQSGMTLGTFDYISPEQARDPRDVDVRSDLYSLGCTLFHTLTGRPPFPGGTVLQKLLQHQEEPPADVRTLNPEVPAELSAIIAKLMAKERDRRYQSPEHLARDLLARAGALGLERVPAELEPWMVHGHHTWWEQHLVWVVPVVGFLVIIGGLAWWGRESGPPAVSGRATADAMSRGKSELNIADTVGGSERSAGAAESAGGSADPRPAIPAAFPRTIHVSSAEDLADVLAKAAPGSVILLADEGPYRVGGRAWSGRIRALPADLDVTIRAEPGVRPVLKGPLESTAGGGTPPILDLTGGHVVIEEVEFELDAGDALEPASAIRCEQTELVLRGCWFRRPARSQEGRDDLAAIEIRSTRRGPAARFDDRPPAVIIDSCHFDGGQIAVKAAGLADVTLRDCTLGPAAPSIRLAETPNESPVPCELRLFHTSILAGAGPVFRFAGGPVRVRVDDCVIAPAGETPAALVLMDDPRMLSWRGRANLYGAINPFVTTPGHTPERATIAEFSAWERGSADLRELGSDVSRGRVWDAANPVELLVQERDNPTRVFLLGPQIAGASDVGARKGPFGSVLKAVRLAQRGPGPRSTPPAPPRAEGIARSDEKPSKRSEGPSDGLKQPDAATGVKEAAPPDDELTGTGPPNPMSLSSMPPMATSGASPADGDANEEPAARPSTPPEPAREENPRDKAAAPSAPDADAARRDEDVVRSVEQFQAMLRHFDDRGGTLRIAPGVELELPPIVVESAAEREVQIVAVPGRGRPRLRLRPTAMPSGSPADWNSLLSLRSGSLRLQGIDLEVPEPETMPADRLAAIALVPGTHLILEDCTVTLAFGRPNSAAIAVQRAPARGGRGVAAAPGDAAASVELRNGFLRSGGDALTVAGGCRATLALRDMMVAADGSLLDALGAARSSGGSTASAPAIDVRLERVAARLKGGLVRSRTTRDEPEMASVWVHADRSILSTVTGDHPLLRLEGQDRLGPVRDKIRWEAHRVAYHRIKVYLRDEVVQVGGLPRIYDRDDWTRAFAPTDDSPTLTELRFLREPDASLPAWKVVRDDLRLDADRSSAPLGPDAGKVPEPPTDEEF